MSTKDNSPAARWGAQSQAKWSEWRAVCVGLILHEAGIFVIKKESK